MFVSCIYCRKKEEFDALADRVIAMPVGEMEKNIQEYLEIQVGSMQYQNDS